MNEKDNGHHLVFDGVSSHNGEYWYKCTLCLLSDWIASYGTKEQLNFYNTPCPMKNKNYENRS